jgi:hypothetical protein
MEAAALYQLAQISIFVGDFERARGQRNERSHDPTS